MIAPAERASTCDVCEGPLCPRGTASTGLCGQCRTDGAAFARGWEAALTQAGLRSQQIADIVGTTAATVRSRRRDVKRMAAARPRAA